MCSKLILNFYLFNKKTKTRLKRRGPDQNNTIELNILNAKIELSGYVLWQQGPEPCIQPVCCSDNFLLLNGDIYTKRSDSNQSDTEWLLNQIQLCNEVWFLKSIEKKNKKMFNQLIG